MASLSRQNALLVAGLGLASIAVITAIAVGGGSAPPAETPPDPQVVDKGPVALEQTDLEGDFELVDPDVIPTAGLEGVITTLSDLPIPLTQRTMRYVAHFGTTEKGKKTFADRMKKASRFREHLEQRIHDQDFPEDVIWLAAIESGFNPQATSPAGAAGLFQFMPETAERFGLTVGSQIDERRSITKSTAAALSYLGFLFDTYGSWDLALAAYNCGEGRLGEAIEKGRAALGRSEDEHVAFHELAELRLLPRETMNFVPQIHAFAIVVHNRELLALDEIETLPFMHFAEVAVPAGTRLAPIARAADISIATLREYNPDLLTDRLPPGRGDYLVNIPAESLDQALAAMPALIARDEAGHGADPATDVPAAVAPPKVAAAGGVVASRATEKAASEAKPKEKSAEPSPPKVTLAPAPMRPGTYMLSSGLYVEIARDESPEVEISARVDVLDPTKARAPTGTTFRLEAKKAKPDELEAALATTKSELAKILQGSAASKLRSSLATRREKFYEKTGFQAMYRGLSERAFAKSHPMHGALLVGPTEPADDMFLEPEPVWALDTTVVLRGPIDPTEQAGLIESALANPFTPSRAPALASPSRASIGKGDRHLLVGWASPPILAKDETAMHLAFVIACHNKLGRLHRALRHDRSIAARANCSLETAPFGSVAWVFASPGTPHTVSDAEKAVDEAIQKLVKDGPTDQEVQAARGLLRTELAREQGAATLRGLPKSRVVANNERILSKLSSVKRADVIAAAKILFDNSHRIVIAGD